MQRISKNKMLSGEEAKTKGNEYFFSGGLEYEPQTVTADTPEEAEKIWVETRMRAGKLSEN